MGDVANWTESGSVPHSYCQYCNWRFYLTAREREIERQNRAAKFPMGVSLWSQSLNTATVFNQKSAARGSMAKRWDRCRADIDKTLARELAARVPY